MDEDALELSRLIESGIAAGEFRSDDASASAARIMALIDGHSVQAAARSRRDSGIVADFAVRAVESELGLPRLSLAS
jgi:hypothetical protein